MLVRVSPKIIALLFSILLLLVVVSGSVAADSTIYGLSVGEAAMLFGNGLPDHDNQPFTDDQIEEIDSGDWLSSNELFGDVTIKWDEPIELPQTWNKNNFDEEVDTLRPSDESLPPESADIESSGSIEYAHASIYEISPSTVVHYHNRTEREINSDGTVRSQVDFLVNVPADYVEFPEPDHIQRVEVEYTLQEAEVDRYELLVNGDVQDSKSDYTNEDEHVSSAEFDFSDVDTGENDIEIEANVSSKILVEVWSTRIVENESDIDDLSGEVVDVSESNGDIEVELYNTRYIEDDLIISDEATVYNKPFEDSEFEFFELPDGSTTSIINTKRPYSSFEVGGETAPDGFWAGLVGSTEDSPPDEIQTDWTFISIRDTGWDQATRAFENENRSVETEMRNTSTLPTERHVYPSGHGPSINETDEGDDDVAFPQSVFDLDEQTKDPVDLPDNVSAYLAENYSDQTNIQTEHIRDVDGEDVEIYGFVDDDPHVIPASEIESTVVTEGNLTVEIEERNMSRDRPTEVTVTLSDEETGEPVDMAEAGGEVLITDHPEQKSVDLGSDGSATVRTNTTGTVHGEYTPPEWTESELPTTGDTDFDYDFRLPEGYEIIEWIIGMTLRLLPIFLTLYVITAFREMFYTGKGRENRPQR